MDKNHSCKTVSKLKTIIQNNKIVVLKLSADWCEPCKLVAPKFIQAAKNVKYNINKLPENIPKPTIQFLSIDIDDVCEDVGVKWGQHLNCTGVPMFLIFFNGKTLDTVIGGDMEQVNNIVEDLIQKSLP